MTNESTHLTALRDWLFEVVGARAEVTQVSTTGSGPFSKEEFDKFLGSLGIDLHTLGAETELLVVGSDKWSKADLRKLIILRSGKTLRVYSQEMFLAYLLSGTDPLHEPVETVLAMAGEHPALMLLSEAGFAWPTTLVCGGGGMMIGTGWRSVSLIRYFGYRVGAKGQPEAERRRILEYAFFSHVPSAFDEEYVRDCGGPGSAVRLQKVAEIIASSTRNAKRKAKVPYRAVTEWERDLEWLKNRFYDGKYQFQWPSTHVW